MWTHDVSLPVSSPPPARQLTRIRTKYAYHRSVKLPTDEEGKVTQQTPTECKRAELLEELEKVTAALEEGHLSHDSSTDKFGKIQLDIRTMTPPALFGEECILNPQQGVALGTFHVSARALCDAVAMLLPDGGGSLPP